MLRKGWSVQMIKIGTRVPAYIITLRTLLLHILVIFVITNTSVLFSQHLDLSVKICFCQQN